VIVPARNEEACLQTCLESLLAQSGVDYEVIVVNDGSSDRTTQIAASFPEVKVVDAGNLEPGWSGKTHAMAVGAMQARGEWFLFTDADTFHLPGALAGALAEAQEKKAALLSYSPQQEVHGFWEKSVMPVIFSDLAMSYRPSEVCDPASPAAAANGQFLMISREAYEAAGGHRAVASSLLEDVALAGLVKRSGRRIVFRYGADRVRTRMYRGFSHLREGWTKNLALLFPSSVRLAIVRFVEFVLIFGSALLAAWAGIKGRTEYAFVALGLCAILAARFWYRIRRAHFPMQANAAAIFGLPLFAYLLLRSRLFYRRGQVGWKGSTYPTDSTIEASSGRRAGNRAPVREIERGSRPVPGSR